MMKDVDDSAKDGTERFIELLSFALNSYADLREQYVDGDSDDYDALSDEDRSIVDEVGGIRKAARIIRDISYAGWYFALPPWTEEQWAMTRQDVVDEIRTYEIAQV